jgi:hypothetical protein
LALNKSARRQIAVSRDQIHLLKTAEVFAAVFLIYYVGTVFHHLFEIQEMKEPGPKMPYLWVWAALIALLGIPLFVVIMGRVLPYVYRLSLFWFQRRWRRFCLRLGWRRSAAKARLRELRRRRLARKTARPTTAGQPGREDRARASGRSRRR